MKFKDYYRQLHDAFLMWKIQKMLKKAKKLELKMLNDAIKINYHG